MWWALSVRCGVPPHVLKQRYTAREATELALYARHNPIDDQANFHVPIASLQATVANLMGGDRMLTDFLLYRDREERGSEAWFGEWFKDPENDRG